MLVFLHGVCSGLKAKVSFICGHAVFVWRAVEGVEKKMEGITDGATCVVPEFGREGGAKWVVRDRRDVYVGEGGHKYSWGCGRSGIKDNRCHGGEDGRGTECCDASITAVTATTQLLCNEEADTVVLMGGSWKQRLQRT